MVLQLALLLGGDQLSFDCGFNSSQLPATITVLTIWEIVPVQRHVLPPAQVP